MQVNPEPQKIQINRVKSRRQTAVVDGRRLRQQLVLVGGLAALVLAALLLPLPDLGRAFRYYFSIHLLLDFFSVVVVVLVFATVWHTPAKEVSTSFLLIAVALFAAGWLDFAHALLFDVPEPSSPFSAEKGAIFWLGGRLMVALTLLLVSLYPQLGPAPGMARFGIFAGFAGLCLLLAWPVFFHAIDLPALRMENGGLTLLGAGLEWCIAALLALAAWRYYRLSRRSDEEVLSLLFGAVAIAGLSEVLLSQYVAVADLRNLLGHAYKFLSYCLFYQAMFVICVNRPYQKLTAQTLLRRKNDETLRTQGLALDSTTTPVIVTDLEGKILWRNRASYALMGRRSSDVEPGSSLFSEPVTLDPVVAERMRATVEAGGVWRGLVHLKDQRGDDVILDRTVTPVRDENGAPKGYISVGENVTQREYAQLRYKRVLDMTIDGFWIANLDGRLCEVNQAYARMSGYSVEELLGMNIGQLEAQEGPVQIQEHIQRIVELGKDRFETRHRHKQGYEITVDVSVIYDPVQQLLFVFVRDRTELVQAAAAKKGLERQLQQSQKVQQLGQLTGGIAHDFNNSLATILGYSRLALDRFVPDKQGKLASYLREVVAASERARDLIAKMLTFASTQPSASADVIAPSAVVQDVVNMMRVSIPSSIEIMSWIEDELYICIDPSELSQVLVNLIINARDAITGHGVIEIRQHRVDIEGKICAASHTSLSGTFAALEVSDTGGGIDPQHMSRLFDPFFTTKEVGKGTGLGLSMVQGILRRSNGHVLVESRLGQGSRFQLLFPIAAPPDTSGGVQPSKASTRAGLGQQIWVVDDEPAVARYLGELLEDWGYQARLFNDPSDLLAAFAGEKNQVDLVITDQTMPGLTGLALARRLHGLRPGLPIILCSGYTDSISQSDVLQHEIRRYFTKPLDPTQLRESLEKEFFQSKLDISR